MDIHKVDFPQETFGDLLRMGSDELHMLLKQDNFLQINSEHTEIEKTEDSKEELKILLSNTPDSTSVSNNIPSATSRLPSIEDYGGPYDFRVELNNQDCDSGKLMFSKALNKIFVMMDHIVPIMFKWIKKESELLLVRALPVFLDQDNFAKPVHRCVAHVSNLEKSNKEFQYVDHIIRCESSNCVYHIDVDSGRLSVLVPLDCPQPGADGTKILYKLMCKNSCIGGINRRSTGVIFTLERKNGEVIGRRMIKIRICSCPRRDFLKEESGKDSDNQHKTGLMKSRKHLKRLSDHKGMVNFQVRLPEAMEKFVATMIKETIMLKPDIELTAAEKAALEDCEKYL